MTSLILLFTTVILWQETERTDRDAKTSTVNASTLLAENIGGIFDKADTLLQAVAYQYRDEKARGEVQADRFNNYLMQALAWSRSFDNVGFVDARGMYQYGKGSGATLDLGDRGFFTELRDKPAGSGGGPMIFSEPVFTRLSRQWALVMARRVEQPDGSFDGIVIIRWDVERLSALLASVDMGRDGVLVLRALDMAQVSRFPKSATSALGPGNRKVSQTLKDLVKESPRAGFYSAVSPLDETERYYAYTLVDGYPFYVIAGQAVNGMVQYWQKSVQLLLVFSVVMIVVVLLGANHMNRLSKKRVRAELSNFAERVLRTSPVAMFLLNEHGLVTRANPAAEKLFDYGDDKLVGMSAAALRPESDDTNGTNRIEDSELLTTLVKEARYQRRDGTSFIALRAVSALPEASGQINYYLETVVDISELKRMQDRLRKHATTDKLTGLLNRRSGDLAIDQAIHDADINDTSCAVLIGDIDHFKLVNDMYGHLVGDRILANVARQLQLALRSGDVCIRWGGEEFLIVLPRCSLGIAQTLADRIRCEIAELNDRQAGGVTMSFGVAQWNRPETSFSLIDRADQALYRAKTSGRNRIEV